MKFYRAKAEMHDYETGYTTVIGELLTEKELIKKFKSLPLSNFNKVEIKKNRTHWSFGARFEDGTCYRDFL